MDPRVAEAPPPHTLRPAARRSPRPRRSRELDPVRRSAFASTAIIVAAVIIEVVALHLDRALGTGTILVAAPFAVAVAAAWGLRRDESLAIAAASVAVGHAFWMPAGEPAWSARSILELASRAAVVAALVWVTDRHRRHAAVAIHAARVDPLTGVLSRHGFFEQAPLADDRTHLARPGTVLFVDLDGLKAVNDRRGHKAGDELIAAFGNVLRSLTGDRDLVARFGGDEFVVFLPDADAFAGWDLSERLLDQLLHPAAGSVRASIGIATATAGATLDRVIQHADHAMYEAKRGGGAQARLYRFERAVGLAQDAADLPEATATVTPISRRARR